METRIPLLSLEEEQLLFGPHDRHVKQVGQQFDVRFSSRGGSLRLQGPEKAVRLLVGRVEDLLAAIRRGEELQPNQVADALMGRESAEVAAVLDPRQPIMDGQAQHRTGGKLPTARTPSQQTYLDLLADKELVFAAGPAGTGKTFLAVAAAVRALREGSVKRLVLTRPAVEAGEHLGFLPGDLEDKVDPYLRPLYDALNDLLSPAAARRMKDLDMIEVAPLAFMRGRTLNDAFVILDEAQNATKGQMKMFLTRLGERTRAVVTGDISQTDLPRGRSGLQDAMKRLHAMEGVGMVEFHPEDVQRSSLVQRIVEAYGDS